MEGVAKSNSPYIARNRTPGILWIVLRRYQYMHYIASTGMMVDEMN
jgi:hypothetical protein